MSKHVPANLPRGRRYRFVANWGAKITDAAGNDHEAMAARVRDVDNREHWRLGRKRPRAKKGLYVETWVFDA